MELSLSRGQRFFSNVRQMLTWARRQPQTNAQPCLVSPEYLCRRDSYYRFSTVAFLTDVDHSQDAAGSQARDNDGCYDFADVVLSHACPVK